MIRQLEPSGSLERPRVPKDLSGLWFVAPFFLLFAAFGVFALLFTLYVSFHTWDPITGTGEFLFRGLKYYGLVLIDGVFWAALLRSLAAGLPGIVLQHLIALPLAFAMHLVYRNSVGRLGTLFFLPYIASPVAISATLGLMYSIVIYPINDLLGAVHDFLPFVPRSVEYQDSFEVFSQIWALVGWNVLLYLMALSAVPRSVLEAAQLDGAGFWRQLTRIVVPIVRPMIFVAFSMSVMTGMQTSTWMPQFENPETVRLPAYINQTAFLYTNFGMASAQTWLFFMALMLIVGLAYAMFGRNFTALETPASLESDHAALRLSPVTTVIVKILIGFGLVSSIYPIVLLFFQATQSSSYQATTFEVGPDARLNYLILLDNLPSFWRNLWNAVYVSGLSSLGAIITSALAGFAFASLEFRFKRQLFAVVMGAMLFPAISSAIPYLMEMRILDWIDTPRALWVPASFSALGVFLVRQFTLNAVPQSTLEAARIDGANDAMMFWHIALPLMKPVLSTVGLLTFVTTWNHIEAASLLMRSDETRLLSQALNLLVTTDVFSRGGGSPGGSALNSAVIAAAIGSIPPLLIYAFTAGNLGRGLGIGGSGFKLPKLGFARPERDSSATPGSSFKPSKFDLAKFDLAGADGVRAIACLMVVFSHLGQRLNMFEQAPAMQAFQAFLMKGSFGVSAFFVLSGMLLSLPFWTRYLEGKPFPNLLEYARRRFVRIAPGFYASLIVVFLIARVLEAGDHAWLRLASGLTFTTAFHWITLFPVELNGPLWSIGFEVVCYALMPLFMIGLFALSRFLAGAQAKLFGSTHTTVKHTTKETLREDARGTTKTITRTTTRSTTKLNTAKGTTSNPGSARVAFIYWIGVLALAILAHGWIVTNMIPDREGRGWEYGLIGGAKFWMPNYNVVGLFAQYCIGVLTAGFIAYRRREIRDLEPNRQRSLIFDRVAISAGILALGLMFVLRNSDDYFLSLGAQPYAFPAFAILVALVLACTPFSRSFRNILDNTFFKYTAKISFGLYIWHYPILEVMRLLHNYNFKYFGISDVWHWAALCSFALIAAYSMASWSYTHIESPFLRNIEHEKKAASSAKKSSAVTA
jgi:ABC-type glycerol-3-phosphate transport system permease component/peptidoglycan/LPS O-acetylase OafA/YrhL